MATPSENPNPSRRTFLKQLGLLIGGTVLSQNTQDASQTTEATYDAAKRFLTQLQSARIDIQLNEYLLKIYTNPLSSHVPNISKHTHILWKHTEAVNHGLEEFERARAQIKRVFPDGIAEEDINLLLKELKNSLEKRIEAYAGKEAGQQIKEAILEEVTDLHRSNMEEIKNILNMTDEQFNAFALQRRKDAVALDKQYKDFFDKIQRGENPKQQAAEKPLFDNTVKISRNVRKDKETGDIIYRIMLPRIASEDKYKTLESKAALGIRTTRLIDEIKWRHPDMEVEPTDPTRGVIFVHTQPQSSAQKILEEAMTTSHNSTISI